MGTDIYGGIEYRPPGIGSDWYEGDPWLTAISLWPLYDQTDYAAFACLFGVRNVAGFSPIAAGRGLPADLSAGLRADLEQPLAVGDLDDATWVNWAELAALDLSATPAHYVGRLTWNAKSLPSRLTRQLVPAQWQSEVREVVGEPPDQWSPDVARLEWETEDLAVRYESLSVGTVLGPDSHWPCVFTVMSALASRFGSDGVRLVVAFD